MLARSICSRQIQNVVRGNKFSVIAWHEEFPHREAPAAERRPAVTAHSKSKSGIQIVARDNQSTVVNMRFAVLGGSSSEAANEKGAAHFLAVNAFQGSNENSGIAGIKFLSDHGASYTASVDRDKIVYDVAVLPDQVPEVVSFMLTQIASPPRYNHVFEENRDSVQMDYDCLHHCHDTMLSELIHEAAFGEASGFGSSLYASNLKSLSVDSVLEYRKKNFVAQNVVIAADGISADALAKLVDAAKIQVAGGATFNLQKPNYVGGEVKVRTFCGDSKSHAALAWPRASGEAGKANAVLGAILRKRLEKKGVKNVSIFKHKYTNAGLFGVTTSGAAGDIEKNFKAVADELKAIASSAPETNSKKTKVAIWNFNHLNSKSAPRDLLQAYLHGVDANKLADTRSVTAEQVQEAAKAALKANPSYAVYGTTTGTPSLSTISKLFH